MLWLLRFLPPYEPEPLSPVAIRMMDMPSQARSQPVPSPAIKPPEPQQREPQKSVPQPPRAKKGGVLAELPKPIREERPEDARIVSRFDSKAQDVGPGESKARKPSGENPRNMPPELALPERYSRFRPTPQETLTPPSPPVPPSSPVPPSLQLQARRLPPPTPRVRPERTRLPDVTQGTKPAPIREKSLSPPAPLPKTRRFPITPEQEIAMLQRDREQTDNAPKQTMQEHFSRLQKHQPLPSFDAPGVYEKGPERPGEGQTEDGGGKYRSIDAFGLKHFSYLIGIKRKIELVFSVPFFMPNHGSVGVPIVGFTVRRSGELAEAVLLRSSGYTVLDKALLEAVKRAAPYGPFPQHLPDGEISIRVYATVS